ncbi:MAG TPA: cytochrome c biogenesis protein ResB [Galbitalea sp.]|nr:cytochrome c biogenesis protein ResB [Galbitalea sp.]
MASSPSSEQNTSDQNHDPKRPSDHFDSEVPDASEVTQPRLGFVGYLRFFWRQLTSMRTALFLLLLVAFAAVPGSLVPQVTSDPNGVIQYKAENPGWSKVLDFLGVFNTYSSVWFSAIYILLFISLVGCIIPRTMHHVAALRSQPPKTPARLDRLPGFLQTEPVALDAEDIDEGIVAARHVLRDARYRTRMFDDSASAERGYLRETGNLVFHIALVGILIAVGIGGGFIWTGQKVVPVGQSFANTLSDYDSISPGRWFDADALSPYRLTLTKFVAKYDESNSTDFGDPTDYTAYVRTQVPGEKPKNQTIKVNSPLEIGGTQIYLLSNGFAPIVTVRNPAGKVVYSAPVPFLPQDTSLTSEGVIKIPDGLAKEVGIIGLFYPTECGDGTCGAAPHSVDPRQINPVLTMQIFTGNLGLNSGKPVNAYSLNTDKLKQLDGRGTGKAGISLTPGKTAKLPNGLGTIEFTKAIHYAGLDIHHDPTQYWVLTFAVLVFLGLLTGLFIPRRRVWIKAVRRGGKVHYEYAGLARGEDPRLDDAVAEIARRHSQLLGLTIRP